MSALDEMVVHSKQCKKDWLRLRGCSCWSQGAIKELTSLRAENARLQKAVEYMVTKFSNLETVNVNKDTGDYSYLIDSELINRFIKEYGKEEK